MTVQSTTYDNFAIAQTSTATSLQVTVAVRPMQLLNADEMRAVVGGPEIRNGDGIVAGSNVG